MKSLTSEASPECQMSFWCFWTEDKSFSLCHLLISIPLVGWVGGGCWVDVPCIAIIWMHVSFWLFHLVCLLSSELQISPHDIIHSNLYWVENIVLPVSNYCSFKTRSFFLFFSPSFDAFSSNSLSSQALGFFLIACGLRFF